MNKPQPMKINGKRAVKDPTGDQAVRNVMSQQKFVERKIGKKVAVVVDRSADWDFDPITGI